MAYLSERTGFVRAMAVAGGLVFVASLSYFLYAYLDRFGRVVPAGPESESIVGPVLLNVGLFALFGLHHSVMARFGPKQWFAAWDLKRVERSAYVWTSSVLFAGVCAGWQPVPGVLWTASTLWAPLLLATQGVGIVLSVRAAARIDVLDLAGIRQAFDLPDREVRLSRTGMYGLVRHPIYLGWLLLVWATPTLTGTRLVFAAISTLYLIVAVPFEERDLVTAFGKDYEDYRRSIKWRFIPFVY